jgi:LacI family transcriptional regulator
MRKTSMQDIADKLGVSKGTVSLVLSGKAKGSRISEEMCRKVKSMAKKMNYQPNEIARSLSTGMTMSIGVVVTDISNEFFGHLTFHIQEQAKKYGYTVITTNTNENLADFENAVTILLNRQIDGIIIVPVDKGQKVVGRIINRRIPMVQIDRFYPDIKANYIIVDNYKSSSEMTELLIRKGCRRIAVICYDINLNALLERRRGCTDMLEQYGLFDPLLVKNIDYENQEKEIEQAIIDLHKNQHQVDAIFFCSRRVFITGVKYMYKEKIKIPEDMQIVCFDKIETFSIANIPINYIEQPIKEMGERAVDILMEQINGSTEIRQCKFDVKLGFANDEA